MDHVAIMKKSWGLMPKILAGQKKIESRWYKNKCSPWGKIEKGDTVYFKNSGELISAKAEVGKVIVFAELSPKKVKDILNKYGKDDGLEKKDLPRFYELFKDKNYCLLVYLKKVKDTKPFDINKKDFGAMSAWVVVDNINKIKIGFQEHILKITRIKNKLAPPQERQG